jgi:putative protease
VCKISHREYYSGFYLPSNEGQIFASSSYIRECDMLCVVKEYDTQTGMALCVQKNRFKVGEKVEVLEPRNGFFEMTVYDILDTEYHNLDEAMHPEMLVWITMPKPVKIHSIIRRAN